MYKHNSHLRRLESEEKTSMSSTIFLPINPITETSVSSSSQKYPMEGQSRIPTKRTGNIIRTSIYKFFQNYQYLTTTAALLAIPFSASVLLSQSLLPSTSLLPTIYRRIGPLFDAAKLPLSSEFFSIIGLNVPQTIASSIIVFPFTFSFLLIAKASIIQSINHNKPSSYLPFSSLLKPLFLTQICNSFIFFSANATCFSLLFFAFNCLYGSGLSSTKTILFLSACGDVFYSIILANAIIICNLALVLSAMEKSGGFVAIAKACLLIRGRTAMAITLALPINLTLAAVEALFHFRIVRAFQRTKDLTPSMALEGVFIAYLYSIIIVLDTIVGCVFFRSCKRACQADHEDKYSYYLIEIEQDFSSSENVKLTKGLP